ncbi:hypothetical protein [Streptomyces sp. NPDC018055]|uniref:hypothetical protein n=1 Tax=Streptomyces sp. NPDC018055 TaxID=3365038 RepID=UPI0037AC5965
MKPEITRKPTARQVEALRTGLVNQQGVIEPSADKRTHEGLVGRGLADWKQPKDLGRDVWGSALCVITTAGRKFLAKLDTAAAPVVAPAPADEQPDAVDVTKLFAPGERVRVVGQSWDVHTRTYTAQPEFIGTVVRYARNGAYRVMEPVHGTSCEYSATGAAVELFKLDVPAPVEERPVGVVVDGLAEDAVRAVYGARFERSGRFETPGAVYASGELGELLRGLGLVREDGSRLMLTERGVAVAEELEARRAVERAARAEELRVVEVRDRGAGVISDEQLDMWVEGRSGKGPQNSVGALRPLDPAVRPAVMREAQAFMNVTPGWNLSSAVWEAAKNVPAGRTPGGDLADTLMKHDPTGEKAAAGAARGQGWKSFVGDAVTAEGDRKPVSAPGNVCKLSGAQCAGGVEFRRTRTHRRGAYLCEEHGGASGAVSAPVAAVERPMAPVVPAPAVEPVSAPVDARAGVLARLDAVWSKGYVTSPCMTSEERRVAAEIVADDYTGGGERLVHGRDRAALVAEYRAKDPFDLMNAYGSVRLRTGGDVWALVARRRSGERVESLAVVVEPHVSGEAYGMTVVSAAGVEGAPNLAAAVAVVAVLAEELRGGATVERHALGALRVVRESGVQMMFRPATV